MLVRDRPRCVWWFRRKNRAIRPSAVLPFRCRRRDSTAVQVLGRQTVRPGPKENKCARDCSFRKRLHHMSLMRAFDHVIAHNACHFGTSSSYCQPTHHSLMDRRTLDPSWDLGYGFGPIRSNRLDRRHARAGDKAGIRPAHPRRRHAQGRTPACLLSCQTIQKPAAETCRKCRELWLGWVEDVVQLACSRIQ